MRYSTDYGNAETGFNLGELTPRHFSFNSHLGACPACHGLGTQLVLRSGADDLRSGAKRWRKERSRRGDAGQNGCRAYYRQLQDALVKHFHVDEDVPFGELPDTFKQALYFGTNGEPIEMEFGSEVPSENAKPFEGLVPQMQRLYEQTESEFTRNRIRAFMTRVPCKTCSGARLKPEILAVTIKDSTGRELNIHQFSELTIEAARDILRRSN